MKISHLVIFHLWALLLARNSVYAKKEEKQASKETHHQMKATAKRAKGSRTLTRNLSLTLNKLLDGKKYKTKTFIQEFFDSLQQNKEQVVTKSFEKSIQRAFEEVDIDNSGTIDKTELYAGMLLLYHNINMIPWGGRKPPPKKKFVLQVFDEYLEMQRSDTGDYLQDALQYDYFERLCKEHFSYVISSVLTRIVLVTIVLPIISWLITELLMITPLRKYVDWVDEILPSILLSLMVFILPYFDNLFIRRVVADKQGFAKFKDLQHRALVIGKAQFNKL